jgi:hypothetical protein
LLFGDADALVVDGELPHLVAGLGVDVDARGLVAAVA